MRIITIEDIRDIYLKAIQRGYGFIFSKISFSWEKRTKSSFNDPDYESSNWWLIPKLKQRWNFLTTGNEEITYELLLSKNYIGNKSAKMLSIGAGSCSHELELARLNPNLEITCLDFSEKLLSVAKSMADEESLGNIHFLANDIYEYNLEGNHYDYILFHSSLHHFKNLEVFIENIHHSIKPSGKLIINEYVGPNRLQFPNNQLREINQCLKLIDKEYLRIFKTNLHKKKYYGCGILRMIISDPTECIESEKILPLIHNKFRIVEEKGYGGNLLMPALKHIAHNFVDLDERKKNCLEKIFRYEDDYLKRNKSDFVFGVYEKTT